jgi:hypothetical protein
MNRYSRKVDANHSELVKLWRDMGATVWDLSGVGKGIADVLVGWRGRWVPVEIKDGTKPPSARRLTPAQILLHGEIRHKELPLYVVTNEEEALAILNAKRTA